MRVGFVCATVLHMFLLELFIDDVLCHRHTGNGGAVYNPGCALLLKKPPTLHLPPSGSPYLVYVGKPKVTPHACLGGPKA